MKSAFFRQTCWRDARYQTGCRMRQDVVAGLAVQIDRLGDFVELIVGTDARHLKRAIVTRIDPGGFVVVPENAGSHGLILSRRPAKFNR
jgi:hypothetical protein